jgi:hypothetical protein
MNPLEQPCIDKWVQDTTAAWGAWNASNKDAAALAALKAALAKADEDAVKCIANTLNISES